MGCASSSPLVNGGGPGGLVETTKTAANDVIKAGENAMNGECLENGLINSHNKLSHKFMNNKTL